MKVSLLLAVSSLHLASAAFVTHHRQPSQSWLGVAVPLTGISSSVNNLQASSRLQMAGGSDFESDFASAMPEAPQLTLREFLEQAADRTISNVQGSLAEGVVAVPELDALRKLRDSGTATDEELSCAIYALMIERGMTYDEDPDTGVLTPTEFVVKDNLDVPEVKEEFSYLYRYGMSLISKGLVSVDNVKKIVTDRLIARTGLDPVAFDDWLGF